MNSFYQNNYFVDFENVGSAGLIGIAELGENDKIKIFYTQNAQTITIDALDMIRKSSACVEFVKVNTGEKNALDFQLVTELGFNIAENLREIKEEPPKYFIISHDKGFSVVYSYWKNKNVSIGLYADLTLTVTTAEYNAKAAEQNKTAQTETCDLLKEIRMYIPDPNKSNQIYTAITSGKTKQEIHSYICKSVYGGNDPLGTDAYKKIKHLI